MPLNAEECGYSLTNSDALTDKSYDFVTFSFQYLQKFVNISLFGNVSCKDI